jgi:uncharacterized protein (DUF1330 family)
MMFNSLTKPAALASCIAVVAFAAGALSATKTPEVEGVAASPACAKPVYMVGTLETTDPAKIKAYGEALFASRIVYKNGGSYVARAKPLETLEGQWPENRSIILATYPCADAARAFYNSEIYQRQIKPLRDGGGEVWLGLFEALSQ